MLLRKDMTCCSSVQHIDAERLRRTINTSEESALLASKALWNTSDLRKKRNMKKWLLNSGRSIPDPNQIDCYSGWNEGKWSDVVNAIDGLRAATAFKEILEGAYTPASVLLVLAPIFPNLRSWWVTFPTSIVKRHCTTWSPICYITFLEASAD